MDKEYKGLKENLERFKNDLTDEKMRLLFSIAYKLGYDQALSITDIILSEERTELPEVGCINSLGCACKEANGYPLTDCNYWQGN